MNRMTEKLTANWRNVDFSKKNDIELLQIQKSRLENLFYLTYNYEAKTNIQKVIRQIIDRIEVLNQENCDHEIAKKLYNDYGVEVCSKCRYVISELCPGE